VEGGGRGQPSPGQGCPRPPGGATHPQMQATEIILWCASGLRRADVSVELSLAHDRCTLQRSCEDQIGSIWDARLAANPSLYNGTKFRLAGFEHKIGFGAAAHDSVTILLGITDYRDYVGSNLAPHWRQLLALDSACPERTGHRGRRLCVPGARRACATCATRGCQNREHFQVAEQDARSGTCLANTVGNAAILETADSHVIYLERSSNVGECPNMLVLPGGHAEPSALGLSSQGRENPARSAAPCHDACYATSLSRQRIPCFQEAVGCCGCKPNGLMATPGGLHFFQRVPRVLIPINNMYCFLRRRMAGTVDGAEHAEGSRPPLGFCTGRGG